MLHDFFSVGSRRGVSVLAALVAVLSFQTPSLAASVIHAPEHSGSSSAAPASIDEAAYRTGRDMNAKYFHHYQ